MALLTELHRRSGTAGLVALALVLIGIFAAGYTIRNRGGVTMPCDRYLAEKPGGKWARLENCTLSRIESVAKTSVGPSATEVYIPVRPAGEKGRVNTRILMVSTAQFDLDFVNHSNGPQSQRASRNTFLAQFGDKLEENRAIEGRVRRSRDLPDRDRAKLMKTLPTLAPEFIIVEERERPGFGLPLILLSAGAVLGAVAAFPHLQRKMKAASNAGHGELFATK